MNLDTPTTLRLVFMGTADFACASLVALLSAPYARVVAVVTQPDRPKGREQRWQPSPVKVFALRHGLPVLQPLRARDPAFVEQLRGITPDLIVVAAYGQLLPPTILDLPRHGCLNVHGSLLPKYRGASPIQSALLNGDTETGVTLMKMDAGMDTGPMVAREATPILPADDAQTLHDRLADLGARLLVRSLPDYVSGRVTPRPQPAEGATPARKITKEDGRVDWSFPASALHNRLRAFTPWPGLFSFLPGEIKPVLVKFWEAEPISDLKGRPGSVLNADKHGIVVACGVGALRITKLQLEGGRKLTAEAFLAGHPLAPGTLIGQGVSAGC